MRTFFFTMSRYIVLVLLLTAPMLAGAQQDTIPAATGIQGTTSEKVTTTKRERRAKAKKSKPPKEKNFKKNWALPYPNPYRAGIYSMILPSAGQFYNKRYWKVPIVWGAFGGLVYLVGFNKDQRDRFNDAYGKSVRNLQHEFSDFPGITADALRNQRNLAAKNLQLTYIGFVAMYALTALDAYVDAHLKSFDITDDISMQIKPVLLGGLNSDLSAGLGLRWSF